MNVSSSNVTLSVAADTGMPCNNGAEHASSAAIRMKIVFLKFILPPYFLTFNNSAEHTNNAAVRMKTVFLIFIAPPFILL